jgi:hypothetical protein
MSQEQDQDQFSESAMETKILQKMDSQLSTLCSRHEMGSVLGDNTISASDLPSAAYEELRKRAPLLFKVLTSAAWSISKSSSGFEHFIGLIYSMLMRQRNPRLTAYSRVMTSLCLRYHAGNQVHIIHGDCFHF